jgi:hypothetical protein
MEEANNLDFTEINALIKEFFEFNGMDDALSTFESEIRSKVVQNSKHQTKQMTQVNKYPKNDKELS